MEIELALEEGLVWDEIYRKVYEIVANCEYSDMRAVNPAYRKDILLDAACSYAKEIAFETAKNAIINMREGIKRKPFECSLVQTVKERTQNEQPP